MHLGYPHLHQESAIRSLSTPMRELGCELMLPLCSALDILFELSTRTLNPMKYNAEDDSAGEVYTA
jgi:hypothetical protein